MGFGSALSYYMVGIAIIGMFVTFAVVQQDSMIEKTNAFSQSAEALKNERQSHMMIRNVTVIGENLHLYIKNDGSQELDLSSIDIFINQTYLTRTESSRILAINVSHDIKNPGLWSPGEELIVNISSSVFPALCDIEVRVSNQHGSTESRTFYGCD